MKITLEDRGSAIAGLARYNLNVSAETIGDVKQLRFLYDYQHEGLKLTLYPDHTGFNIQIGKYPEDEPHGIVWGVPHNPK